MHIWLSPHLNLVSAGLNLILSHPSLTSSYLLWSYHRPEFWFIPLHPSFQLSWITIVSFKQLFHWLRWEIFPSATGFVLLCEKRHQTEWGRGGGGRCCSNWTDCAEPNISHSLILFTPNCSPSKPELYLHGLQSVCPNPKQTLALHTPRKPFQSSIFSACLLEYRASNQTNYD